MIGADAIAEILRRENTEFIACYPRNGVIEACARIGIRPILCRQERIGVGMAEGYSRVHRGARIGVFAAQAGAQESGGGLTILLKCGRDNESNFLFQGRKVNALSRFMGL